MVNQDELKKMAATEALKYIKSGMSVGLGTGSTVKFFLEGLSLLVKDGMKITGVPTSVETARIARTLGITFNDEFTGKIDIDVDGADEIDPSGNLIKGGGGALLREKIVARNSSMVIIIADEMKLKEEFIGAFKVPVEIFPFLHRNTIARIEELGGKCHLRNNGNFVTDNGNLVADCDFGMIKDPARLESMIKLIPGVAEVGIFTSLCDMIILGTPGGHRTIKIKKV